MATRMNRRRVLRLTAGTATASWLAGCTGAEDGQTTEPAGETETVGQVDESQQSPTPSPTPDPFSGVGVECDTVEEIDPDSNDINNCIYDLLGSVDIEQSAGEYDITLEYGGVLRRGSS